MKIYEDLFMPKKGGGKMKGRSIFILGLVIGLTLTGFPAASHAARVLDLGDPIGGPPGEAPLRVALEFFSAEVPKRTNGEIVINYHPQTIVTNEVKAVEMCKVGALAFAGTGGGIGTIFPTTQPLMLPYLLRNYAHYYGVVRGRIGKQMEAEIEKKHNLKIISWLEFGFRQFANTKRPLNSLDDFKGLKLRVMPSPPLADMVNALGASAVPISWAEAIPAVQQGVVDGLDLPVANLISMKIYEICKYAAMSNHYFGPTVVVANLNIWKTLTKQQQDIILQLGIEAGDKNWAMMEKMDLDGKNLLEKRGMKVTTPDLGPFKEVAKAKVYPKYYATFGKEIIQSIMDFK
jgi:tripartite ATP-independent transporter DctP family solute receptor